MRESSVSLPVTSASERSCCSTLSPSAEIRVGDELALELKRALQAGEQLVEGIAELLELVVGPAEVQPLVEVGGGDLPGSCGDRAQRPQEPPGHQPTECKREPGHDRQGDPGCDQQFTPVGTVLGDTDRWVQQAPSGCARCMSPSTGSAQPHHDGYGQHGGARSEEDRKEENGETHPDGAP
jgi:hypothetical protein